MMAHPGSKISWIEEKLNTVISKLVLGVVAVISIDTDLRSPVRWAVQV